MNTTATRPRTHPQAGPETGQDHPEPARPAGDSERSATEISTALADLRVAGDAVGGKEWLSVELAGEPAVSLGMLGSTASPLSALASAGCDFLTPMISFLEEPLGQLRGEPDSVSGPAGEHGGAARGADSVADDYSSTVESETSEWSGSAKESYTETAGKLTDGIKSVAETAATNSKAMIAAGEVVAQVVDVVTRLITEAVGKIVPIMTEAIAMAPQTFGASIAQAIPRCVAIAADYAGRIAAKLGALLASGENLTKLIEGAVGALKVAREGLSVIGDLAGGGDSAGPSSTGTGRSTESAASGTSTAPGTSTAAGTSGTSSAAGDGEAQPDEKQGDVDNPLDGEWIPAKEGQA